MIDLKGEGADVREGKGKGEEEKKWELGTGVCYSSWHFWAAGPGTRIWRAGGWGKRRVSALAATLQQRHGFRSRGDTSRRAEASTDKLIAGCEYRHNDDQAHM